MFDKIKKWFVKPEPVKEEPKKVKGPRPKKEKSVLSAKDEATAKGEPYVAILRVDIDPNDVNNGAFELDWNQKFVINLIKAGYKGKDDVPDSVIVDRWFQTVCRNVALELYEQQQADPANRDLRVINTKDIGDGRTEVS